MDLEFVRNNIDIHRKHWKHIFTTNCYAYALGLDIKEKDIKPFAYQPGVMGGYLYSVNSSKYFAYSSLIEGIFADMKKLNIEIREINTTDRVSADEWKIALFTVFHAVEFYSEWLSGFHFLIEKEDGIWYHKPGYYKLPTNKDYDNCIITDPKNCYLGNKEFRKCYSLRLNR